MTNIKQKVIFTKGMQASGKSTWATKFVEENQDYKRVNRDSIRHMLSNYTFDDKNEKIVTSIETGMIKSLLQDGYNLVMDNMNLNKKNLDKQITYIKSIVEDLEIVIMEFPITLGEAIERDSKREFPIGKSVLKKTWNRYEIELKQMLERAKPIYAENKDLKRCCIFDLDGTISDSVNRGIFNGKEIYKDIVIEQTKKLLNILQEHMYVFIFSGRSDEWKFNTIEWLRSNDINFDEIHMRKADDKRDDTIVKSEMFEEHIHNKYYCEFVIDDRPKVVAAWISKGLFVFNVNQDPYCKNDF